MVNCRLRKFQIGLLDLSAPEVYGVQEEKNAKEDAI